MQPHPVHRDTAVIATKGQDVNQRMNENTQAAAISVAAVGTPAPSVS